MLWETVKLAMSSIRRNVLRSVLTLLGIVIGVGAVIAMVTLGNGASTKVQENLAKLGSNMLIVRPGQSTFGPGGTSDARAFDERDVAALKNNLTGIKGVAPTAQKQAKTVYGSLNYDRCACRGLLEGLGGGYWGGKQAANTPVGLHSAASHRVVIWHPTPPPPPPPAGQCDAEL